MLIRPSLIRNCNANLEWSRTACYEYQVTSLTSFFDIRVTITDGDFTLVQVVEREATFNFTLPYDGLFYVTFEYLNEEGEVTATLEDYLFEICALTECWRSLMDQLCRAGKLLNCCEDTIDDKKIRQTLNELTAILFLLNAYIEDYYKNFPIIGFPSEDRAAAVEEIRQIMAKVNQFTAICKIDCGKLNIDFKPCGCDDTPPEPVKKKPCGCGCNDC